MNKIDHLKNVIAKDYCIGCGLCAPISQGKLKVKFNHDGFYQPDGQWDQIDPTIATRILQVCPFSDDGAHENEIAASKFSHLPHDEAIGYYEAIAASSVIDDKQRFKASSGGIVTWLLTRLMELGKIDGVLHIGDEVPSDMSKKYFKYRISRTTEAIQSGGKSKYYPVELSEVIAELLEKPGRYAIVGLPCFIKALRRYALIDKRIQSSIHYSIGIVCGHLKSKAFAEAYVLASGGHPEQIERFEFRAKNDTGRASDYMIHFEQNGQSIKLPANKEIFADWSLGAFKYNACDYCDDVFAETADLVVGDAWLPSYLNDPKGTSLVISRNKYLSSLLESGRATGELQSEPLTPEQACQSQAGGLRHRRRYLPYRIGLKKAAGVWVPKKRTFGMPPHLELLERISQRLRIFTKNLSIQLWAKYGTPLKWKRFKLSFFLVAKLNKLINKIRRLRVGRKN
ncbi:Coenzyme F420 hydrogenase/dehydrogenase, beta subunit C-terminal domain [Coraliomargarita sp. W4R53]